MTEEQRKELRKELVDICLKYGITGASFTGQTADSYTGIIHIDRDEANKNWFDAVENVGRLWQSCRETVRRILDGYEKIP